MSSAWSRPPPGLSGVSSQSFNWTWCSPPRPAIFVPQGCFPQPPSRAGAGWSASSLQAAVHLVLRLATEDEHGRLSGSLPVGRSSPGPPTGDRLSPCRRLRASLTWTRCLCVCYSCCCFNCGMTDLVTAVCCFASDANPIFYTREKYTVFTLLHQVRE